MGLTYANRNFLPAPDSGTPIPATVPVAAATAAAAVAFTEIWTTRDERSVEGQYELSHERVGVVPWLRMEEVVVEGEEAA